jgi:hypothetical protein
MPTVPRKIATLGLGQILLIASLFCMLLFAIVWAAAAWHSADGTQMSVHGWIALGLGVFFSLSIGCGLMVLMFYSSRSGYDEVATPKFQERPSDQAGIEHEADNSSGTAMEMAEVVPFVQKTGWPAGSVPPNPPADPSQDRS